MNVSRPPELLFSSSAPARRAATLVEMMITLSVFTLVFLALISVHIFGLTYDEVVGSKLGSSDQSRMALGHLLAEIRGAKGYQVGSVSGSTFSGDANGTTQTGNALMIYTTNDLSAYIEYYLVSTDKGGELRRIQSGHSGYEVEADYLTNSSAYGTNISIFTSEDYTGATQNTTYSATTSTSNTKWVIHIILQFYQYEYPVTKVGSGYFYDYYKMEFKVAPRATL